MAELLFLIDSFLDGISFLHFLLFKCFGFCCFRDTESTIRHGKIGSNSNQMVLFTII